MKTNLLALILSLLLVPFQLIQAQRCSHTSSFQKSMLSDTLDAINYVIHLNELDFTNHEISAVCEVEIMSKVENLQMVSLELQALTVDAVTVDGTVYTNFSQSGNFLHIPLTTPFTTGDIFSVNVTYHGEPFHESWGGFHWSGQYAFNLGVGFVSIPHNLGKTWFPCIDDFLDRATYEVYATVEESKDAVCGGLLLNVVDNGNGSKTYHWKLNQTIPTYLASVAVGDYARWTDTYNGVNEDVPVEIWVRPNDSANVDNAFLNLNNILSVFENHYGPYRWDRVGYVGTAIGAMEHACNIAYPHSSINGTLGSESLYAHELSHMWFGDNVTCASAEDMWLNEGWAVFSEALFREFLYGKQDYIDYINEKHAHVIQFCHTPSGDGSYFPLNQIPQEITYGMSAYDRGSTIAHSLRGYLGDSIFFDAIAGYNEYFKYSPASSYDMRDFLTDHTGQDMSDWFDNWVFNSGTPHYSVDSFNIIPAGNEFDITVYLKQKRHGPAFAGNSNRIELTFFNSQWQQFTQMVSFDGQTGTEMIQLPFAPEFIIPDFHELQSDAITDRTEIIHETGHINFTTTFFEIEVESINDSALVYIGHQWAPPDPLLTPVQGLTISDYRYWVVDGIFPAGFNAQGVFWYNKTAYLDDGIISTSADSVMLLYRPSAAYDWQLVETTTVGIWNIGKLYVANLQKGQYTIAVADDTFVGFPEQKKNTGLRVFPNPSNTRFNIQTSQAGIIRIYDVGGQLVNLLPVDSKSNFTVWEVADHPQGTYFLKFISDEDQLLATKKLVIVKQ